MSVSPDPSPPATRLIAMGQAPLMEGFRLVGLETYPDASPETVERVLGELVLTGARALVLLEHHLSRTEGPLLTRVRNEGGRIVVTEIPSLSAPTNYAPAVDQLVRSILGPGALEDREATNE